MTEENLSPIQPSSTVIQRAKAILTKRVILILSALLFIGAGSAVFTNFQASSEFKSFVSEIELLLDQDQLNQAKSELSASKEKYGEKEDFKRLVATANELTKSKDAFLTAENYFSDGRYIEAISYYKKVKASDKARLDLSVGKIEESSKLAVASALSKANQLITKKDFVGALSVLNEVNSLAGNSSEFKSLKSEVSPLAAEQVRKEEAAANAKYVSALRSMRVQKDKFNDITFYIDRSTPYYADNTKFYLYIGKREGSEPYLRMEVRYSDDDWLFVEQAEIKIDGTVYDLDLSSSDWETDNGSGDIWEWADVPATDYHLSIIDKVIKSRSAFIRFTGSKYYDDRTITSTQKRAFVNVLNAYEALKRGLKS